MALADGRDVASCTADGSSVLAIRGEASVDSTAVGPPRAEREELATAPTSALTA